MTVLRPSEPQNLAAKDETLSFSCPKFLGGSRIQFYEVHLKEVGSGGEEDAWFLFKNLSVKYLSPEPVLEDKLLHGLHGSFRIRVFAVNLAGVGEFAELSVSLTGTSKFSPTSESEIGEDHFRLKLVTFWEEIIFVSNHGDTPKDWRTIRCSYRLAIENIREFHGRSITRSLHVTDTGGENWGGQPLSLYSHSEADLGTSSIWAPTTANHSGQPSDSTGGTFKRWIKNESAAGHLQGVNDDAHHSSSWSGREFVVVLHVWTISLVDVNFR